MHKGTVAAAPHGPRSTSSDWSLDKGAAEAADARLRAAAVEPGRRRESLLGGYSRGGGALTDAARDRVRPRHVRAGVGGAGGGRRPCRRGLGGARARPVPGRSVGHPVRSGAGYANAAPTCTLTSLPRLEWGVQFQHYWFNQSPGDRPASGAEPLRSISCPKTRASASASTSVPASTCAPATSSGDVACAGDDSAERPHPPEPECRLAIPATSQHAR